MTADRGVRADRRRRLGAGLHSVAMSHEQVLVRVVRALSSARDLGAVTAVVRRAARELTGADGADVVLRDGALCRCVDEDEVAPLWKGRSVPLDASVSGWTMLHGEAAVVEDVALDPRVPQDLYRPTFVRSLAVVPIRAEDPVGAIGAYWAAARRPAEDEVSRLQALADVTAVAMENVRARAEARRWRALLDEASDSVWTIDPSDGTGSGGVAHWWSKVTGRPVEAYRGSADAWLDDVLPEDREATAAAWHGSLRDGTPYRARYRIRAKDGTVRHILVRAAALPRPDGSHEMVGVISDVTAERQAAEATQVLRQLSRRLLTAQDEERRRISRDLHDDLGQALTAAKLSLANARPGMSAEAHAAAVRGAMDALDHAVRQTRDLSLRLHPPMLDILGLGPTLRWFLGERLREAPLDAQVTIAVGDARLPAAVESACFRLVQEAVTNALRHSEARALAVSVEERPEALVVSVRDDGRGFDPADAWARAAAGGSAGLAGMQERVALAGGSFEVVSRPGEGARIGARLPIPERA